MIKNIDELVSMVYKKYIVLLIDQPKKADLSLPN